MDDPFSYFCTLQSAHFMKNNQPIGFFDSGVGGLSVLHEALKLLPDENYIYYSDEHSPVSGPETSDICSFRFTDAAITQIFSGLHHSA